MNKKKKKKEPLHLTPEEIEFEDQLENMLRSTGYLFPITPDQVDTYQKLKLEEESLNVTKDIPDDSKKKKK